MDPRELEKENLAQTLARELKAPVKMADANARIDVALPPGWTLANIDHEELLDAPRRIKTAAVLATKDAFCEYVARHQVGVTSTVWCAADPEKSRTTFLAVLDDHTPNPSTGAAMPGWRKHRASFEPAPSIEWARWTAHNGKAVDQMAFACFIEDNLGDIHGGEGHPSGAEMLAMAVDFQAKQDHAFKSAIRQQSGSVRMEFVAADTAQTVEAMKVFDRFRIGIPIFRDDTARFPIEARLRYRNPGGKLSFWYELIRPDKMFEQSSKELVSYIRDKCALPFFFGNPG